MKIIESKPDMHEYSLRRRGEGNSVGLVPTMGALHQGHLSLVRKARQECDFLVVSVFVNPTQFGPGEDLEKYPRTFEADRRACEELGVDVLFAPSNDEMYPAGPETYVVQEHLTKVLEGASRPTHFRGVLTVVLKLLNIVVPHAAYFGQKDYQQSVVVRRMAADLDVPVEIRVLPTVREEDGLAMSSRNKYLSPEQRDQAACLYESLRLCGDLFARGERNAQKIKTELQARIDKAPLARIDYVEIVKPNTLQPAETVESGDVALVAVFFGTTRLIDNVILS